MRISDWSSDVCSSDLIRHVSDAHAVTPILRIATLGAIAAGMSPVLERFIRKEPETQVQVHHFAHEEGMLDMLRRRDVDIAYSSVAKTTWGLTFTATRSEERRVGKEGGSTVRTRWATDPSQKNQDIRQELEQQ